MWPVLPGASPVGEGGEITLTGAALVAANMGILAPLV